MRWRKIQTNPVGLKTRASGTGGKKAVGCVTIAPVNCITTVSENWTSGKESVPSNGRCHLMG